MNSDGARLLGTWRTDPDDTWSQREYGDVTLLFEPEGRLVYTIHLPTKDQIMLLTYRVEGMLLLTNQPSSPREERAEFYFTPEGRLAVKNQSPARPTFYLRV
jgi:hypothetical protein